MPFFIPFDLIFEHPRTFLAALVVMVPLSIYCAVLLSNETDKRDREFTAYMANCIERHMEAECLSFRRWGRDDLGRR